MESPFPAAVTFVVQMQVPGAPAPGPAALAGLGPAASPRRRAQYALGRACAQEALRRIGAPEGVTIGRRDGRLPDWPAGYVGSITHSHQWAAAAAAPSAAFRGLGVDLERVRIPSAALLERISRPAERDRVAGLASDRLGAAFTALFAAKESLYKAVNPLTGVYLGFADAEVTFSAATDWGGTGGDFVWRLEKEVGAGFLVGYGGVGAWRRQDEWMVAGVWIAA